MFFSFSNILFFSSIIAIILLFFSFYFNVEVKLLLLLVSSLLLLLLLVLIDHKEFEIKNFKKSGLYVWTGKDITKRITEIEHLYHAEDFDQCLKKYLCDDEFIWNWNLIEVEVNFDCKFEVLFDNIPGDLVGIEKSWCLTYYLNIEQFLIIF